MTAAVRPRRPDVRDPRRATRVTVLCATALLIPSAFGSLASAQSASGTAGVATLTGPRDGTGVAGPAAGGGASASFSLELPDGAACTGDSIEGGYRVQSFMVPEAVDPAGLTFEGMGPSNKGVGAAFRQPLFAVNTAAFANAATNLAEEPGGPGAIINIPNFSLGVFKPGDVPEGRYTIGIACTLGPASPTQLDRFWSTTFEVGAPDAAGLPTWSAPEESDGNSAAPAGAGATEGTPAAAGAADESGTVDAAEAVSADEAASASTGRPPSFNLPLVVSLRNAGPDGYSGPQLVVLSLIVLVLVRIGIVLTRAVQIVRDLP